MATEMASFAADLSPEIDRLFIAGHRAARPLAMALRDRVGLDEFGCLIDLRLQLLAPNGMSFDEARAIQRYIAPAETLRSIQNAVEGRLIQKAADRWSPTPLGHEVLDGLTEALIVGTGELWHAHEANCLRAIDWMDMVITHVSLDDSAEVPAFNAVLRGRPVVATPWAYHVWWHLVALRYLRADLHAAAWRHAGLTMDEVVTLTHLCHNQTGDCVTESGALSPSRIAALARLATMGWIEEAEGGWRSTHAGRALRRSIEDETNVITGIRYAVLPLSDRLALLHTLRSLRAD
jgi:hypothetical protein